MSMLKRGWRAVSDRVREQFGVPVSLRRLLADNASKLQVALEIAPGAVAVGSVTRWHEWGEAWRDEGESFQAGELRGWKTQRNFRYCAHRQVNPELLSLGTCVREPRWHCDIQDVAGLQAARAELLKFDSLDAFALAKARSLMSEATRTHLSSLLSHRELRFLRRFRGGEHFFHPLWDGRVFLANQGGSAHFAAARHIAARIGQAVALGGELRRCSLEPLAVNGLRRDFELFAVSTRDAGAGAALHDALRRLRAPYLGKPMPAPHADAQVLFLPRGDKRAMAVAAELRAAGLPDVGRHLSALVLRQHMNLARQGENAQAQAA
jgi:hypothetical protein